MRITKNTTALVTGASGGIGQAICRALHAAGAQLVVTGRRAELLDALGAELGARVVVADLARRDDVQRCLDEVGSIDVLVANAALPASGALLDFPEAHIDRALDVNLRAPLLMARYFARGMVERRRGQIVFVSSLSGIVATPGTAVYSATKFGLRGAALGLRGDLHGTGVGVTTIFPGFIRDAGMFAESGIALPAGVGTRSPEDVARAVLRAIARDPAEITVAALSQRVGAVLAGLSQPLVAALVRMADGQKRATAIAAKQIDKR